MYSDTAKKITLSLHDALPISNALIDWLSDAGALQGLRGSKAAGKGTKQTEPTQQPAAKKPSWPYRSTGRRAVEGSVHRVGRSAGKMDVLWRLPSHTKLLFYTNAFTLAVIG